MIALVTYRSRYGHSRRYAQWLAESLSAQCVDLDESPPASFDGVDVAVVIAPIYAGRLLDLDAFMKPAIAEPATKLIGVTVCGGNPDSADTKKTLDGATASATPAELANRMRWFHLRGGIDYPNLHFADRTIMKFVNQRIKQQARGGDADAAEQVGGIGKHLDHSNPDALAPVIAYARS